MHSYPLFSHMIPLILPPLSSSEEVRDLVCNATTRAPCREGVAASLIKGHGVMTGNCVPSDRYVCHSADRLTTHESGRHAKHG